MHVWSNSSELQLMQQVANIFKKEVGSIKESGQNSGFGQSQRVKVLTLLKWIAWIDDLRSG